MTEDDVVDLIADALELKFPNSEIVRHEDELSHYITVIDDVVTFDVVINMGAN